MSGTEAFRQLDAQAARTLAEIHGLEKALDGAELTVTGSMGQVKGNPLLAELRAHRLLWLRLMGVTGPEAGAPDELDQIRREWEGGRALSP